MAEHFYVINWRAYQEMCKDSEKELSCRKITWDEAAELPDGFFENALKHAKNVRSLSAPTTIGDLWKRFEAKEDESNGL